MGLPSGPAFAQTGGVVAGHGLRTVCKSAKCPNIFECFSKGVATFLILGEACTRRCLFCNIETAPPTPPDPDEPRRVAEAALALKLSHVVVTSVTRDDLPDGGAGHFARTVAEARSLLPWATVEALIPDFAGRDASLRMVAAARPHVVNHNVETPPAHYGRIRPQGDFARSISLLRRVRELGVASKSGFMVGLGESDEEVRELLDILGACGCQIATVGQYMRPSRRHPPVQRYVHPDVFAEYAVWGRDAGIPYVFSTPLARSSYSARAAYEALLSARPETP